MSENKYWSDTIDDTLISKGEHKGFMWCVKHNRMGFRCGYVRIPFGHPWHNIDYNQIDANVHGGLTFGKTFRDGYWIGFDCAHLNDAQDITLPHTTKINFHSANAQVRDLKYVEDECRSLCEQASVNEHQN